MATRRLPRPALLIVVLALALAVTSAVRPQVAHADPQQSINQVQARIDALNQQAEAAAERYNAAQIKLAAISKNLVQVKARLTSAQQKVNQAQAVLGAYAAATYQAGGIDPAIQLLLAKDPAAFLEQASALNQIARQQGQTVVSLTAARLQLAQSQRVVAQQLAAQKAAQAQLKAQKDQVLAKIAEAQRLLNSLQAQQRAALLATQARARAAALAARASYSSYVRVSRSSVRASAPTVSASGRPAAALRYAFAHLGDPYVWGAAGPHAFDCSGLTMMAWRAAGVSLPHNAAMQYNSIRHVPMSQLQPGDLVFYLGLNHVGIYIGGGRIIDAPHPGSSVEIVGLYSMPIVGAGRP